MIGGSHVFSRADLTRIGYDAPFWENAWLMAITLAVLKTAHKLDRSGASALQGSELRSGLRGIFENPRLATITDHFAHVISLTIAQHMTARDDLQGSLAPAFRAVRSPMAAFIDNVDEHFNEHLAGNGGVVRSSYGATSKNVWYQAQTGLANAIRALHVQNHHIKLFASIRSEAFAQLTHNSPVATQLEGEALRIEYDGDDLREIFVRNLMAEAKSRCVAPRAREPFERVFGRPCLYVDHPHVGEAEPIWDYILRHTLGRPRDLMVIGAALAQLTPDKRSVENIRRKVNEEAGALATQYLSQIKPHLASDIDFDALFALVPRNILRKTEIKKLAAAYNRTASVKRSSAIHHPFCALYKGGLLGYVTQDVGTARLVQKFAAPPGDLLFAGDRVLPSSRYYILHPALDGPIRLKCADYTHGFDTLNIAGNGRLWREVTEARGIVKADVVGFSEIMLNAELAPTFAGDFKRYLEESASLLEHMKIEGGDTFVLRDRNAANLLAAVKAVAARLHASPYRARLRVGADFGQVPRSSSPVMRTAARLEAVSPSGGVCATREFRNAVDSIGGRYEWAPASALKEFEDVQRRAEEYNLRKKEGDPDLYREVYYFRLEL